MASDIEHADGSWQREFIIQLKLGLPQSFSALVRRLIDASTLGFVGSLGDATQLAAAGLASSTTNILALSVFVGMSSATVTLTSQAKGAGDSAQSAYWLHRALLMNVTLSVPITLLLLLGFAPVLSAMGQDATVTAAAAAYCSCLLPGVWAWGANTALLPWLQCFGIVRTPLVVTLLLLPFHILLLKLLVSGSLGPLGAALTWSTTLVLLVSLVVASVFCIRKLRALVPLRCPGAASCERLPAHLRLGCPGIINMGEWWASEIAILLTGLLPEPPGSTRGLNLAAMTVYQSLNSIAFMWPLGASSAGAARVGALLGSGHAAGARRAAAVCFTLGTSLGILATLVLLLLREQSAHAFTADPAVIALLRALLPNLLFYIVADAGQVACSGVLNGCGRQRFGVPVTILSYYIVGLPTGVLFGFEFGLGWGAIGMVTGLLIGKAVHLAAFAALCLRTDWQQQVGEAAARVDAERGGGRKGEIRAVGRGEEERGRHGGESGASGVSMDRPFEATDLGEQAAPPGDQAGGSGEQAAANLAHAPAKQSPTPSAPSAPPAQPAAATLNYVLPDRITRSRMSRYAHLEDD